MGKTYTLPPLPYAYDALEPYISQQIMTLHHDKHHNAYVTGANAALDKLEKARAGTLQIDIKGTLRDLSFNMGGHKLHSIFWNNMAAAGKGGGGVPSGKLADKIIQDFGGFDKFKAQFSDAAKAVEGSGWALLLYDSGAGPTCADSGREAELHASARAPHPAWAGRLGTCILPPVLERQGEVRGGMVERGQLVGRRPAPLEGPSMT